jgi:hypothetical protein
MQCGTARRHSSGSRSVSKSARLLSGKLRRRWSASVPSCLEGVALLLIWMICAPSRLECSYVAHVVVHRLRAVRTVRQRNGTRASPGYGRDSGADPCRARAAGGGG